MYVFLKAGFLYLTLPIVKLQASLAPDPSHCKRGAREGSGQLTIAELFQQQPDNWSVTSRC